MADAARHAEAASEDRRPTNKDVKEEVDKNQYTVLQWEEGKTWTLGSKSQEVELPSIVTRHFFWT